MTPRRTPVVAIDIGGTSIKGARVSADGEILARARVATPVAEGAEAILETLARLCRSLAGRHSVQTIGLGVPGAIAPRRGVVHASPNVPCWHDEPLGPRLARRLGLRVRLDNDANLHALGEHWRGAGRGARNLLLATLGTGVGGGLILDGRVWHGDTGRAGELGHTVVDPHGPPCACGARGCVEAYASATGIVGAWRRAWSVDPARPRPRDRRILADTPETIAGRARRGDARARAVYEAAGRALGIAVADWIQILDIRTVLLGGGVAGAFDLLEPAVRRELQHRLFGVEPGTIRLERAALGNDAGILGAARLALGRAAPAPR